MGTSGSFGGSTTASWKAVASYIDSAPGEGDSPPPAQLPIPGEAADTVGDDTPPKPTGSDLAALVGKAIADDDPSLRPKWAPAPKTGDSGLRLGALTGRPRRVGTNAKPPSGGRRQVIQGTGRAGRAVGAGYALVSKNSAALKSYGLDLASLQGKSKFEQIMDIMDAVGVGNAGPDDIALREAIVVVLNGLLDAAAPGDPTDTLKELIAAYACNLFQVELDALVQDGKLTTATRDRHFRELEEVIHLKASALDCSAAQLASPEQFENAAQQMMRATIDLVIRSQQ